MLYPLSYEGGASDTTKRGPAANERRTSGGLLDDVGEQFERAVERVQCGARRGLDPAATRRDADEKLG